MNMTFDTILSIDPSLLCQFLRKYDGEIISSNLSTYPWTQHDPVLCPFTNASALVHLPNAEMVFMSECYILYCREDGEILHLWKWAESGKRGKIYIGDVAYDEKNGLLIVVNTFQNSLVLYTKSGQLVRTVKHPQLIRPLSLIRLPNGSWMVRTNADNGDIMIWTNHDSEDRDTWSVWEHSDVLHDRMARTLYLLSDGFVCCDEFSSTTRQVYAFDPSGSITWIHDLPMDTEIMCMITLPNDHTILALLDDTPYTVYLYEINEHGDYVRTLRLPDDDIINDPVHLSIHQGTLYVCDERNDYVVMFYDIC